MPPMTETIFFLFVIIGLAKVVYDDATDRVWQDLSTRYPAQWRKNPWDTIATMHAWDDRSSRRRWYNGVHISFESDGLRFDPTLLNRWYRRSILVPWSELQRQPDDAIKGNLVLKLKNRPTWIAINKKYYDESTVASLI